MSRQQVVTAELANGAVTTAKILDATVGTVDLANSAVTNAKLASDTARANLLTNGGFEIWQRGNGPFTANGAYTADRWTNYTEGAATISTVANTGFVMTSSRTSAAITITSSGGAGQRAGLAQKVELSGGQLRSAVVTFSCWIYSTGSASVFVYGSSASGGATISQTVALVAGWNFVTAPHTVHNAALDLTIYLMFGNAGAASGTFYIDNAMLVVGSVAADYAPLHPADDLARCLRYYEVAGNGVADGWLMGGGVATAASQAFWLTAPFKARKAVQPTVTKIGTWTVANCGQPTVWQSSNNDTVLLATSTAAGALNFYTDATGKNLVIEANP